MKKTILEVDHRKKIIAKSDWPKKKLADVHVEALLFCEFGCDYCSSNSGLQLRFLNNTLNKLVVKETGQEWNPHNATHIAIAYHGLVEALERELNSCRRRPGAGKTLVYSQLTDGFSPVLLQTETARRVLELLIEKTDYRIRILTKNAIVGNREWVSFFTKHHERFVVGLSTGSLDAAFSKRMETMTSIPASRLKALRTLQDAGVPTFGMLCPVFPQVLHTGELEQLIDGIRPERCEHIWAEPFNDRNCWEQVQEVYRGNQPMIDWFDRVYRDGDKSLWSRYAAQLYLRLRGHAEKHGWLSKLRYLLYEANVEASDAASFGSLEGVLLQSPADNDGNSKNPAFAAAG